MPTRRSFLATALAGAGALALGDPYLQPLLGQRAPHRSRPPVRTRGRVTSRGRAVAGAAISDGRSVVETDAEGWFEIVSREGEQFVFLSVPAGYRLPVTRHGTVTMHRAIRADARGEATVQYVLEPLDDATHAFLVLADPQTQNAYETGLLHETTVPDVQRTVVALGDVPVFGVACGDIMYDDLSLYPEWERAVERMGVPFVQVVGNHDLDVQAQTDERSTETFQRHFGPAYYSFDRGAVHYVVLDDVMWHGAGYLGYVDQRQLDWLAADLARVEAGRTVVVFAHIPAYSTRFIRRGESRPTIGQSMANREALYRLLEPYRAHVMSGHTHEHEHTFEGGVHEHVHGAVCGAWWSGPICWDGTPTGYGVYEVRGETLRWRYQSTGEAETHQMRLYPHGADPAHPDDVVANVWGWDPEWTVVWYEDGERRGAMERRTGLDPLSVKLHTGPELPPRRSWVEPTPTDHLFYAPASRAAREVRVEAIDRWGTSYTEILTPQ